MIKKKKKQKSQNKTRFVLDFRIRQTLGTRGNVKRTNIINRNDNEFVFRILNEVVILKTRTHSSRVYYTLLYTVGNVQTRGANTT